MVVDNTVQWLQLNLKETGLPVGFEYFTMNRNIPAGSLPLQGGLYSRLAYPDLWEWVQKQTGYLKAESEWQELAVSNGGNVPFYSKGDGSTTFRVPALKCWVKGASNISEVGGYLVAGLPNIDTNVYIGQDGSGYPNGSADSTTVGSTASYPRKTKLFRDSDYNTIYGTSDTVQPPSIVGLWCVKAYGTVTNVGSTDVSNIAQGLANAETRISVLNTLVGAENNGGIVAALLEQNGYVKFSNGLILQWGVSVTSNTGPVTITYPIAHTIFACPYTTSTMSFEAVAAINTNNNTVQSFDVHARWSNSNAAEWAADTFNWFSVGI